MGRVARYKKIKACDPFAKGKRRVTIGGEAVWGLGDDGRKAKKRSKKAEKLRALKRKKGKLDKFVDREFDAPPDDGDEFDLHDLIGSVKKVKHQPIDNEIIRPSIPPVTKTSVATEHSPAPTKKANLEEEVAANRLLKLERQVAPKNDENIHQPRLPGESKQAYRRRVAAETRQIIKKEMTESLNPEKRKRKNEFLKNKKKAKKKKSCPKMTSSVDDDADVVLDNDAESTLVTGEQAYAKRALETQVIFGEQAERPPVFKQLPRKAVPKSLKETSGNENADDLEAKQKEMELIRRKVRAQYALLRAKRHAAGDFHL